MVVTEGNKSRHPRRAQVDRSAATRSALIAAATELFTERGYADTPREAICQRAGVTRGALDHHFDGKRDLFRAVFEALENQQAERIAAAGALADPLARFRAGCRAFVEAASDPALRRIVHTEARAVLGWQEWHEIHKRYGLGLMLRGLRELADASLLADRRLEPLAQMLLGALSEAAMFVASSDLPRRARAAALAEVDWLCESLVGGQPSR